MNTRRLAAAVCYIMASTGFIQHSTTGFRPADIQAMLFLPPVAVVSIVAQGNRSQYDPDASVDAAELLRQALLRHEDKLHLQGQLVVKDSAQREALPRFTIQTINLLESQHKRPLALPLPWLDTLLAARKQRYCLLSCVGGYTRTPGNYRGQLAKDLGIGLLSLGLVIPITSKCSTRVNIFIYDARQQAIVYYKATWPAEKDPLAGVVIDRELTDLLAKDFNLTDRI